MPDIRHRKLQTLTTCREQLLQEFDAAIKQSTIAIQATDRIRYQREADDLIERINQIEDRIQSLKFEPPEDAANAAKPNAARIRELQSKLSEIDFRLLEEAIRKILRDYGEEGCAAAPLLFQKSARMGGEWCAGRIRELLRRETNNGQFRYIPVEFQPTERVEAMTLLRRLGQDLGVDPADMEPHSFSQCVVQKLCGSLQNGSVVMIECRRCDYFFCETDIFRWFLEDFWENMVRALATVARSYYEVKVIVLLFIDGTLPESCLTTDQCCTLEQFQKHKLLEVPLEPWTREDIRQWIARYSGLRLNHAQLNLMADKVYGSTDGLPTLVVHELLKECCLMTAD